MTFVQIGELNWLLGRQKRSIFVKMFKNLLSDSLNLIGCRGNIKSEFLKSRLKVTYMFMALTNSLVVLFIAVLLQIF